MYKVVWDPETGGILFRESISEGISQEIRPVFFEELDLLGFHSYWEYPQTPFPLLWSASNSRQYYYQGELVAEVRGGAFFREPKLILHKKRLSLQPVDIDGMLAKNEASLRDLTHEALDFITTTYTQHHKRVSLSSVAFSGGKDSVVVLDLVQRALEPSQFVVVFNDTGMEISPTYEAVLDAQKRYSNLHFYTSRSHMRATESWRQFGPPSRFHRWCCTVHKSAPNFLLLRELSGDSSARILLFDGVRADESNARAAYGRISKGKKHTPQINVSPILHWNSAEVFLYILQRGLHLNSAYRFGLVRVGCSLCPFSSEWSGAIYWKAFLDDCKPLLDVLYDYAKVCGKKRRDDQEEFIAGQAWAMRAGGKSLLSKPRVSKGTDALALRFTISSAGHVKDRFLEWLKVIGQIHYSGNGVVKVFAPRNSFQLTIEESDKYTSFSAVSQTGLDTVLQGHLGMIANKSAYCVGCRVCEAECPTGAIRILCGKGVEIIEERCIHCLNCLKFVEKGCLVAKSLQITKGREKMTGLNRYQGFGLDGRWLEQFFKDPEVFWDTSNLGNRQVEAFRAWLYEAEFIGKDRQLTELGKLILRFGTSSMLTWNVLFTNLARNSRIVKWFLTKVAWGEALSSSQLVDRIGDDFSQRTRQNAVNALAGLFEKTPLGGAVGPVAVRKEKRVRVLYKQGVSTLSVASALYSLYRFSERTGRYHMEFKDVYQALEEGPYVIFGIEPEALKRVLRAAANMAPSLISIDFVRDLESIYLSQDIRPIEVLHEGNRLDQI